MTNIWLRLIRNALDLRMHSRQNKVIEIDMMAGVVDIDTDQLTTGAEIEHAPAATSMLSTLGCSRRSM